MQANSETVGASITGTIQLCGQVNAPDFPVWISRHAAKLGVELLATQRTPQSFVLQVAGAHEMIHALALACSLGPRSVLVDEMNVQITP